MKRFLIVLLIVVSNNLCGQEFRFSNDSLYFPVLSSECKDGLDEISNLYWSELLKQCEKESIYRVSNNTEIYRVLFYGQYIYVIEIYKKDNKILYRIDSLINWDKKKWDRKTETLQLDSNYNKLKKSTDSLWTKNSIEGDCHHLIATNDDSNVWVLECKIGTKYKVIERHKPDIEIINTINYLLDICKVKNKNIRPL